MSFDERVMLTVAQAAAKVKLEFVLVGNAAAAMQGVPLLTHDVDVFVRKTPRNRQKIAAFAAVLGGVVTQPYEPTSEMLRVLTPSVSVDFMFGLSSRRKFESVRSRALREKLGSTVVLVAALSDVIAAKEAAGRPKDKATLGILKNALRVKQEMEKETGTKTKHE
jgi:hypothetical protein